MINNNINDINCSFNGRCSQIKDAQWVCHAVNSIYPHVSTTKFSAYLYKLKMQNPDVYSRFLNKEPFFIVDIKSLKELWLARMFDWQQKMVNKINKIRKEWLELSQNDYGCINNLIAQLKYEKMGNCGEDAMLAQAILKMNGIDNVYTAALKVKNTEIDHSVCVFNRDGSPLNGKVSKKTIIIDPWLGTADFASNMFLKYKNLCKNYFFRIKDNSKIQLCNIKGSNISGEELLLLSLKHDEFLFPSITKEFMQ